MDFIHEGILKYKKKEDLTMMRQKRLNAVRAKVILVLLSII